MNDDIKCIVFDLGGVLVQWNGIRPLIELSGGLLTPERARLFWLDSPSVRRFETGVCTAEQFAESVASELNLSIGCDEFLAAFVSWDEGPLPGAAALLESLKPRFTLACLSNNNELHWRAPALQELLRLFHRCYASFETGLMKPAETAFEWVIADLNVQPDQVLFFDDNRECIDATRRVGMHAHEVRGVKAVRTKLRQLGIDLYQ
jgi:putative hydrolase of the HAD superfamily